MAVYACCFKDQGIIWWSTFWYSDIVVWSTQWCLKKVVLHFKSHEEWNGNLLILVLKRFELFQRKALYKYVLLLYLFSEFGSCYLVFDFFISIFAFQKLVNLVIGSLCIRVTALWIVSKIKCYKYYIIIIYNAMLIYLVLLYLL